MFDEDFEDGDLTTNWKEQTEGGFLSNAVPDPKDETNKVL